MLPRSLAIIVRVLLTVVICLPGIVSQPVRAGEPTATWQLAVLDSAGDVGYFTSTAVDKNNKVHISYMDYTNHVLKYATNATGVWTFANVRALNGLQNTAIGVDSTGKVYIAYVAGSAGGVAIRDLAGNWTTTSAGFHYALANGISLAIDHNNVVHVAAATRQQIQYQPDTYRMEYANNASGTFQVVKYLPTCMSGAITLRSPSVATDAANKVYVAFNVSDALAYATNKSGDWACKYIQMSGAQPVYSSNRYFAVKSTGQPVVAVIGGTEFMALALNAQDKAHIVGHQSNCLRYFTDITGAQTAEYLDCTAAKVGEYGSVAADSQGGVHIAYFDRTNGDLKYATQGAVAPIQRKTYLPLLLRQPAPAPSPSATPTATATLADVASATPTATATLADAATPTPSVTPSVTPSATPSLTPSPTPTLGVTGIYNGGFEERSGGQIYGWTKYSSSGAAVFISEFWSNFHVTPHNGSVMAFLAGSHSELEYVEQTTVGVSPAAATLGYWLWIASYESTCGNDVGKVLVNGAVVAQYDLCSATATGGWVKRSVDLTAYAGQTVTVQFRSETNGSTYSYLFLDDINFE